MNFQINEPAKKNRNFQILMYFLVFTQYISTGLLTTAITTT